MSKVNSNSKTGAALISLVSNGVLVVAKAIVGGVTGSLTILIEAMHSSIDLVASAVALVSVRKADEPADESHLYGHGKVEDLAGAVEGALILVGSLIIAIEAIRHLVSGNKVEFVTMGIVVMAISVVVNMIVSSYLAKRAVQTRSSALAGDAAHLRSDAYTSIGALVGLILVSLTGKSWVDPVVALLLAGAISVAGARIAKRSADVLTDAALPQAELELIGDAVHELSSEGVVGFHKLRGRRAGSNSHIDLHVQFSEGITLERAHELAHHLQDRIAERIPGADVLIHLEPEESARDKGSSGSGMRKRSE